MDTDSFFDPRSAAVYGNGGGTRVKNTLNQANIPQTDQFRLVSDLNVLNCWQGITIYDDFVNTNYQDERPVESKYPDENDANGEKAISQVVFEFNLMGYVDLQKMFLELDAFGTSSAYANLPISFPGQGQLSFLSNILRARFEFGTNNFVIGTDTKVQEIGGIKTISIDGAKTTIEKQILGQLGLSRSVCTFGTGITSTFDDLSLIYESQGQINQQNVPTKAYHRICIPFWCLHPFFKREGVYLPTGLKIRLTLDFLRSFEDFYKPNTNCIFTYGFKQRGSNEIARDFIWEEGSNMRIVYQYNTLKEASNNKFISMWGDRPLLYNFFDYGLESFRFKGVTNTVDEIFLINKALPLEIFLRPVLTTDTGKTGYFNITKMSSSSGKYSYVSGDFVARLNECAPYTMNHIKIFANGVLIKEIDGNTNYQNKDYVGLTAEENIMNLNREQHSYDDPRQLWNCTNQLNNNYTATPFKINLTPGDIYNLHKLPIDMGTTQLRVKCEISTPIGTPFPKEFSLEMYYKYPSQLLINNRYTCVSVQWPAISNGSYEFITPTFGSN